MIVNIKGKEVTLKKSFRSYIMFESITDRAFAPKGLTDIITYFYCVVMSSEKGLEIEFEEFIDWIDENNDVFSEFNEWLYNVNKVDEGLTKKKTKASKAKTK